MTNYAVIIPAHNSEGTIERAVKSVLNQNAADLDCLVIDDGSTDETAAVVERLMQGDPRLRIIRQENLGVSSARNRGLNEVRGEWVAFLDADDWVEPNWVQSALESAAATGAQIVMSGAIVDYENALGQLERQEIRCPCGATFPSDGPDANTAFTPLLGYVWNKIYRRDLISGLYFRANMSLFEDLRFNREAFGRAEITTFLPYAYVHYVQAQRRTLGARQHSEPIGLYIDACKNFDFILRSLGVSEERRREEVGALEKQHLLGKLKSIVALDNYSDARHFLLDDHVKPILENRHGDRMLSAAKRVLLAFLRRPFLRTVAVSGLATFINISQKYRCSQTFKK